MFGSVHKRALHVTQEIRKVKRDPRREGSTISMKGPSKPPL